MSLVVCNTLSITVCDTSPIPFYLTGDLTNLYINFISDLKGIPEFLFNFKLISPAENDGNIRDF